MTLSSPPTSMIYSTVLPCQICGLGPPHVMELKIICRHIKREQSHWRRLPMTHNFGMFCKKINYRQN
jgi:hypothetical protein